MDPFFLFVAFSALTPATNHLAVMYHRTLNPDDYYELSITLNKKESKERAKYMARLLKKMGAKEGTTAAGNWLLDDMLRFDGSDTDPEKKS